MNKKFDFEQVGKKTPYITPDHFFEETQKEVLKRTYDVKRKKRLMMLLFTGLAMTAFLSGLLFVPSFYENPTKGGVPNEGFTVDGKGNDVSDKWIKELSDEELEELVNFSNNDIFLN